MTKEELKSKLDKRAAKRAQEKAETERIEKELFDKQISRLTELAKDMQEDIEMERMMREHGIHNADFCWDGSGRHEGLGFEAGSGELRYIIKNLHTSGLAVTDVLVALNPWKPEEGFLMEGENNTFPNKYDGVTAKFIEDFCDRYEGFHEDYHAWLSSGDWDAWDENE